MIMSLSIPEYAPPGDPAVRVLCLGMHFRNPTGIAKHSDDVRLRMLGHITRGSAVMAVGADHLTPDNEVYMTSDVSRVRVRRASSWIDVAMRSHVVILDYFFIPHIYFNPGHGYGDTWFKRDGQVRALLAPDSETRAVLLPHCAPLRDLYDAGERELTHLSMRVLTEEEARRVHPLVMATLAAERDTAWLRFVPRGAVASVFHRTEMHSGRAFLRGERRDPFMLVHRKEDKTEHVMNWLDSLTRVSGRDLPSSG